MTSPTNSPVPTASAFAADSVPAASAPADSAAAAAAAADAHAENGSYLDNDEALRILATHDSGIKPELSKRAYRMVKRLFDVVCSGLAVVILLIPSLVLCIVICAKSPGASPIYRQTRVGRVKPDGSFYAFSMLKFRSMVPHADDYLRELQSRNEASGPLFKIKEDPRVIGGVGGFIRKHSIDELPQLLNVFVGQMSLIGPRPGLPREVALYDERAMRRLAVKPGCGGAWQTRGRSDLTFDDMVLFDLDYIENRGIGQDLRLIFDTIKAMLNGIGAA